MHLDMTETISDRIRNYINYHNTFLIKRSFPLKKKSGHIHTWLKHRVHTESRFLFFALLVLLIELLLLLFMTKFFSLWGLLFFHSKANFNVGLVSSQAHRNVGGLLGFVPTIILHRQILQLQGIS